MNTYYVPDTQEQKGDIFLPLSCSLFIICSLIGNILCSFKNKNTKSASWTTLDLLVFKPLLHSPKWCICIGETHMHTLYEITMSVKYLKLNYKSVVYQYCLVHTPIFKGVGLWWPNAAIHRIFSTYYIIALNAIWHFIAAH